MCVVCVCVWLTRDLVYGRRVNPAVRTAAADARVSHSTVDPRHVSDAVEGE